MAFLLKVGWRDTELDIILFITECPLDWVVLPDIGSDKVKCALSSNCTRIDCCVDFSLLNLKLHFFLHFDRCNYVISGGIEKKTFSYGLLDFTDLWGTLLKILLNTFSVISIPYRLDQTCIKCNIVHYFDEIICELIKEMQEIFY